MGDELDRVLEFAELHGCDDEILGLAAAPYGMGHGWSDVARAHALAARRMRRVEQSKGSQKRTLHYKAHEWGYSAHDHTGAQVGSIHDTPSPDTPHISSYYAHHSVRGETHNNGGIGHEGPGALENAQKELEDAHKRHLASKKPEPKPPKSGPGSRTGALNQAERERYMRQLRNPNSAESKAERAASGEDEP